MQPTAASSRPRRQRTKTTKATVESDEDYEYNGYDDEGGARREEDAPSKIKLKVGGEGGGGGGGHDSGGIGWDRELDSDADVPLAVEEHFLLRLPPHLAGGLREQIESRNVGPEIWFKFKDSRRAVFHLGEKLYGAKLVDLPALLESQKLTGQGGQSIKVADISQMLLVEDEVKDEAEVTADKAFNIEDFIYPHGITPPLKHVRKRRFRKRINKRVRRAWSKRLQFTMVLSCCSYCLADHRDCRKRGREAAGARRTRRASAVRCVAQCPASPGPSARADI